MRMLGEPDVVELVVQELGTGVRSVDPLAGSVTNQSWRVATDADTVAVKCCPEADWSNETTALTRLASSPAVPTARLLAAGHRASAPWLILQWIDGAPADTARERYDAGRAVKRLHELEAETGSPPTSSESPPTSDRDAADAPTATELVPAAACRDADAPRSTNGTTALSCSCLSTIRSRRTGMREAADHPVDR